MKNGSIVVVILTLTILLSCPGYASDRIKIGFILKTMQEERYQKDRSVFLGQGQGVGGDRTVRFML